MSLNSLPDELLLEVVRYLHPTPGPQLDKAHWGLLGESESSDICQLANTSTRFYNLCRLRLYTTYIQNGDANLSLFLRTLVARPDLAQHTRFVNVVPGRNDNDLKPWFEDSGPNERMRITTTIRTVAPEIGEPSVGNWFNQIVLGKWQYSVGLLLASLPNLEEVHIPDLGHPEKELFTHIHEAIERAAKLQKESVISSLAMNKLRRVSIGWNRGLLLKDKHNDWGSIDIKLVIPYLTLPSIDTFYGMELRTDPVGPSSWSHHVGLEVGPGITTMKLIRCNLTPETLRDFLRPLEHIETFYYEEGGEHIGDYDCDPRGFILALAHLKQTLKHFTFINAGTKHNWTVERMILGLFKDFEKLETIDTMAFSMISFEALDSDPETPEPPRLVDIIPPSLRILRLRECETRRKVVQEVLRLVKHKERYAPNFRMVVLDRTGDDYAKGEVNSFWKGVKRMKGTPDLVLTKARWGHVLATKLTAVFKQSGDDVACMKKDLQDIDGN